MLNLSQRLILGCVLLAGLTVGLVIVTHHALAAAGQSRVAYIFILAAALVELGTIYSVLRPIHCWPATRAGSPRATWSIGWNGGATTTLASSPPS